MLRETTETHTETARVTDRVSFIIPTRNSVRTIAACVASAVDQRGDVEVIVVDNHSSDGTPAVATRAGAHLVLRGGPERSAQRNQGFAASTGAAVVFIDSDMVVHPGVADDIRLAFAADPAVGGLVLPEHAFGEGYLAGCRAFEKRAYVGEAGVEAARAFRATAAKELGGYNEFITGLEDYELPDRLEAAGWSVGRTAAGVDHDEGRVRLRPLFAKKRYYGQMSAGVTGFNWGRRTRRSPARLAREAVRDPLHAPGFLLLKAVDAAGLLTGYSTRKLSSYRSC